VNADTSVFSETDRKDLHDLVVEHAWLLDHGKWHDVAELYLDDGSLSIGAHTLHGRAQLLAWADQRATNPDRQTHHQCTNIRIVGGAENSASGTVMLVLHVSNGGAQPHIEFVGEYRDLYRRDDMGRWRFHARHLCALSDATGRPPKADRSH
jgi:3-phenylpropionate/cinnamic acid dioxygenase small subunit